MNRPSFAVRVSISLSIMVLLVISALAGPCVVERNAEGHAASATGFQYPSIFVIVSVSPSRCQVCGQIRVKMNVQNMLNVTLWDLKASIAVVGGGVSLLYGPLPISVAELDPLRIVTFEWVFHAENAGTVSFRGNASGDNSQTLLKESSNVDTSDPVTIITGPPANLTGELAAEMSAAPRYTKVGEELEVKMNVTNLGEAALSDVAPRPMENLGAGLITLISGPTPSKLQFLESGRNATFSWTFRVDLAGDVVFRCEVNGTSPTMEEVASGLVSSGPVQIFQPDDLILLGVDPIQVVRAPSFLVEGKNTIFSATIFSTFDEPKKVKVLMDFSPGDWSLPEGAVWGVERYLTSLHIPIHPNAITKVLPLPHWADMPNQSICSGELDVLHAPRPVGDLVGVRIFIDPTSSQIVAEPTAGLIEEADETENNRFPREPAEYEFYAIEDMNDLMVTYVGLGFDGEGIPWPPTASTGWSDFILGTYPVAESEFDFDVHPKCVELEFLDIAELTEAAQVAIPEALVVSGRVRISELKQQGLLMDEDVGYGVLLAIQRYLAACSWMSGRNSTRSKYHRLVGVVPEGWFANFDVDGDGAPDDWLGMTLPMVRGAVLVDGSKGPEPRAAHEIGHTYGLSPRTVDHEEYATGHHPDVSSTYWTGDQWEQTSGYWVNRLKEMVSPCFMGDKEPAWIDATCYEHLLNEFKWPAEEQFDLLGVRGLMYMDGTAALDPCYRISGMAADIPPGGVGNCSLVMLDANGRILRRAYFNASFEVWGDAHVQRDVTAFAFTTPFYEGTSEIQLRDLHQRVLATRRVSENPPSVDVLFPNGGEVLDPGGSHLISWAGFDPDGDQLTYAVLISRDAGETWIPLSVDASGRNLTWATGSFQEGASYLVRVLATDGVNTGGDTSDGVFSLGVGKNPIAVIKSRKEGKSLVIFDGSESHDPDGEIATYEWDFGDGTGARGPSAQHIYPQGGEFVAKLIVTDNDGRKNSAIVVVTIEADPVVRAEEAIRVAVEAIDKAEDEGRTEGLREAMDRLERAQTSFSGGEYAGAEALAYEARDLAEASTAPSPFDFTITASPSTRTVRKGQRATYEISISLVEGIPRPIKLSLGGLPVSATYAFDPSSVLPNGTSRLIVETGEVLGRHVLVIGGSNKWANRSLQVELVVESTRRWLLVLAIALVSALAVALILLGRMRRRGGYRDLLRGRGPWFGLSEAKAA